MKTAEFVAEGAHDQLIALVAHELRHPLLPIRNAAALLKREPSDAVAVRRAAEIIERQAADLHRLIGDLVDVSAMQLGALPLQRVRASLGDLIERTMESVLPAMNEHGHALSVSVSSEPLYLEMDVMRMGQAVQNIVDNATRYTQERGHIEVRAQRHGEWAQIVVSDTGIGIPPSELEAIFGLFVNSTLGGRVEPGLGLGLYLARRFVEAHGGTVTAASAGPGQGSVFTINLPCEPAIEASRQTNVAGPAADPTPA